MWIYKIRAEKKYDFWKIPKNCVNAESHSFEEMLRTDNKRMVKSALCNWFSDKIKGEKFCIAMNGYDFIHLQSDKENKEFHFHNFNIVGDYLVHHTNEIEYKQINFLAGRAQKLCKLMNKI
jgi:hypothetical protein